MKNLERFVDKKMYNAAAAFAHETGMEYGHEWNIEDWANFGIWLWENYTKKYTVKYKIKGNPYEQTYELPAVDMHDAEIKFMAFVKNHDIPLEGSPNIWA